MATILKDGNIPHLKIKCVACECEYDVTYKDLVGRYDDEILDSVVCPCCNFGTKLTDKAVRVLTTMERLGLVINLNAKKVQY